MVDLKYSITDEIISTNFTDFVHDDTRQVFEFHLKNTEYVKQAYENQDGRKIK